MKNWKLGTKITLGITIIVIICMSLLYLTANKTMTGMMQESELKVMKNTLNAQAKSAQRIRCTSGIHPHCFQ